MKFYFRSSTSHKPAADYKSCYPAKPDYLKHAIPTPKSPCPSPKPPHKKGKIDFKCLKKDTINSLNEVEHFLCNFQNIYKYIKLYKVLK